MIDSKDRQQWSDPLDSTQVSPDLKNLHREARHGSSERRTEHPKHRELHPEKSAQPDGTRAPVNRAQQGLCVRARGREEPACCLLESSIRHPASPSSLSSSDTSRRSCCESSGYERLQSKCPANCEVPSDEQGAPWNLHSQRRR